jgi:hypothetical protein
VVEAFSLIAARTPEAAARRSSSASGSSLRPTATTVPAFVASPPGATTTCPFSPVKPSRASVGARSAASSSVRTPSTRTSVLTVEGLAVLTETSGKEEADERAGVEGAMSPM